MITLLWLAGWLIVGEAIAALSALLVPESLRKKAGGFAWYWASLRVTAWPLVFIIAFFYALSLPVEMVWSRLEKHGQARTTT